MIEVHAEFPQREVIQVNAVVDNEEKTVSEVIISAKPEITGVTASVDNETGTPYVEVTETGTGTEFSFDLAFHNLKGDKGEQGETGQTGNGIASITKTATVGLEDDYTINFTDGTQTVYTVTNGADGQDGADGQAATITVGTTTTGAAGTNASVVNSGTSSAAIFDFTIPRGNTGATGVSVTGVSLISTQGLQKTYRMTFSNNTYYDYIVTDGASGSTAWGTISGTLSSQTDLQTELTGLQSQIDTLVQSSEVFDIVGTYTDLQNYDISTVPVNDIIKVLVDSTHSNAATYYRCVESGGVKSWSYIGAEGAYYTKSETDTLLNDKYDASNPAGYTTNVGTVTSVNNTQPDANGNVTIQTGGANTDLSNLTATGETHFQAPLVSGTNIKTINNNSILGSGDLTVTASITSTDVTNALGYTPENQANKVTSITSSSTDTQYPSAKSVITLLKTIYPVGCVYLTTNSTCPLSSLFGTWSLVSSGKALWTGTGSNGGTTIAAGLPNIKGTLCALQHDSYYTGAFTQSSMSGAYQGASSGRGPAKATFSATGSNTIYGNSTTVQPPAYVVNVFRRTA